MRRPVDVARSLAISLLLLGCLAGRLDQEEGRYGEALGPGPKGRGHHLTAAGAWHLGGGPRSLRKLAQAAAQWRGATPATFPEARGGLHIARLSYADFSDGAAAQRKTASCSLSGSRSPSRAAAMIFCATSLVSGSDLSASPSE
jgi:hypothetical protein